MDDYYNNAPPIPEPEFDIFSDKITIDQDQQKKYDEWMAKREEITAFKDGSGDETSIYLDFSKNFRQKLKKIDPKRGYIHVVTAHEFRHVQKINTGTEIYYGTNEAEKDAVETQNIVAKQFNRFKIRKFRTDVDQYNKN